ncbi:MAG: SDR family oxidoreductase [Bacteroides sp.]|jgi:NAD(P)-dependent dehydrogenase (short-subunit alcohol dehydrogenase family)|nr:SDR family oxidoreductase [Bacteroides sp.]
MRKVILITGVSSGFGKAIALELTRQGHVVYGTSRRDGIKTEEERLLKADVTRASDVEQTVEEIVAQEGRIDVLINNAGFGLAGAIEDYNEEEAHLEIETNLLGAYRCSKSVLPHMRRQGAGTIITISSIAGLFGIPFQGFYSASKSGLEGLMQALRYEVSPYGVNVVVVNPGDFNTGFTVNRKMVANTRESDYKDRFLTTLEVIEKDEGEGLRPEILAKKVASIVKKRNPKPRYIVASLDQKLAVVLSKILPSRLFFRIIGSHYKV